MRSIIIITCLWMLSTPLLASPNCPQGHCSKIAASMNDFCKANNLSGKPYLVFGPSGSMCYCGCSCVTDDTLVSRNETELSLIGRLLAGDSIYSPMSEGYDSIDTVLRSEVTNGKIYEISFENGSTLKASGNHTLVTPDEKVKTVESLNIGDEILDENAQSTQVTSIVLNTNFTGELRNLIINDESTRPKDHLIITNGLLSGDWLLQTTNDQVEKEIDLRSDKVILVK